MRVYDAIVLGLAEIGVDCAFGGAGEADASLMVALKNTPNIRAVITKHEQAAGFMACGYAMYTDKLGFCFATSGPGAFNLFSGLAIALSDSYPVLAISGISAEQWWGKGALNETSGQSRTPDSRAMFAATTKGSFVIDHESKTMDTLEAAVTLAFEGRPGPVHIHVPENLTHPDVSVAYRPIGTVMSAPLAPDPAQIRDAAKLLAEDLNSGRKVLALVGFGAVRSRARQALTELAEHFQIPIVTTMDGQGVVPESHSLSVGLFCDSGQKTAWKAFVEADTILAIGNSFAQHATFDFSSELGLQPASRTPHPMSRHPRRLRRRKVGQKRLVHINLSAHEINKVYVADAAIVGDATESLRALDAELHRLGVRPSSWRPPQQDYAQEHLWQLGRKIHPGKLVEALSARIPDNAIVLADAGTHAAWLAYYLRLTGDRRFRKPGGFGAMAGHTNAAIGVKLAHPDRPVIVGCGDACYLLSGFELMTAVQHRIPVIWIIFDDSEFKLIKLYQLSEYHQSGLVEFPNPDWAAYAAACGAIGLRATTLREFEVALDTALKADAPVIIDAHITRFALPHYSITPRGELRGLLEMLGRRIHVLSGDKGGRAQ
jgi:acetolactate synthase-1/2/3 large subunit